MKVGYSIKLYLHINAWISCFSLTDETVLWNLSTPSNYPSFLSLESVLSRHIWPYKTSVSNVLHFGDRLLFTKQCMDKLYTRQRLFKSICSVWLVRLNTLLNKDGWNLLRCFFNVLLHKNNVQVKFYVTRWGCWFTTFAETAEIHSPNPTISTMTKKGYTIICLFAFSFLEASKSAYISLSHLLLPFLNI